MNLLIDLPQIDWETRLLVLKILSSVGRLLQLITAFISSHAGFPSFFIVISVCLSDHNCSTTSPLSLKF